MLTPRPGEKSENSAKAHVDAQEQPTITVSGEQEGLWRLQHQARTNVTLTAEQIVAQKLARFAKHQRALAHKLAEHYGLQVPTDVERFFDELDAGNLAEAEAIFKTLRDGEYSGTPHDDSLRKFWRPIVEAAGAEEAVQAWPAQALLDYGNGILNSLPPGMTYVGGTDPGCFIPTMLNGANDGDQRIMMTQNALADGTYLDYLRAAYGDSLNVPTEDDLQAAFQQYLQDALQRQQHDLDFPNEPPQLLPGENISMQDGKPQASGAVAVMGVNNILMQDVVRENPGMSFGMEESFPMSSTYPGAAPLGPIMQLNASQDGGNAITPEAAETTVNYWQEEAANLQGDVTSATSDTVMKSYSHDAVAAGNLLENNGYSDQAAQAYQTALEMYPSSAEAVGGLAKALSQQGQYDQANAALDNFLASNPSQQATVANLRKQYGGK